MKMRNAYATDLSCILDIYNKVVKTSAVTFDIEEQSLDERKKWFTQFGECYPIIVAEENGQVIGYACLTKFRSKPAYDQTVEDSIYLSEQARGKGTGALLLKALLDEARTRNYHTVVAVIANDEPASVNLHKKFGFQKTGCLREVGYKFDKWHDIHFYQLSLMES